ncbi:hypothetical protein CDAR_238831 [Caerostris darwini]|uniref:RNase H type-1 domain-containing protein n=1 Tax=Caerostris darwini TaxID=1538125 RepID=A0AAV4PSF8_9ARAC|nr:hypothetical protein CDAR_238831 [Caerostris darwini]
MRKTQIMDPPGSGQLRAGIWGGQGHLHNTPFKTAALFKTGFLQEVLKLKDSYNLNFKLENLPTILCSPLDCRIFNVVTDLVPAVRELDISCDVLRSISYATINELYPESEWLRIYADGSRMEQRMNADTGIFCGLSVYVPVGRFASAYDGEVEALRIALTQL